VVVNTVWRVVEIVKYCNSQARMLSDHKSQDSQD